MYNKLGGTACHPSLHMGISAGIMSGSIIRMLTLIAHVAEARAQNI